MRSVIALIRLTSIWRTDALVFGNLKDPASKVTKLSKDERQFRVLEEQGTEPSVFYLKRVDKNAPDDEAHE